MGRGVARGDGVGDRGTGVSNRHDTIASVSNLVRVCSSSLMFFVSFLTL